MNRLLLPGALAVAFLLGSTPAHAGTITLTPAEMIPANLGSTNCEPGCVYTAFGLLNDGSLSLYYRANVAPQGQTAAVEEGASPFVAAYNTIFANLVNDPQDATIAFGGGTSIPCPRCFLVVKDGNQNPSFYFYNLGSWNGTDTIELRGFWPNQGAISHLSIWGAEEIDIPHAPEPATLMLVGVGLTAGLSRLRRRARS
jgi:hypothetical protein